MPAIETLFVYGTLQFSRVQEKVLGRIPPLTPDTLDGYALTTLSIEGKLYPAAVKNAHASIEGAVMQLSPDELLALDRYETRAYLRVKEKLQSGIEAWVYTKLKK